MESNKDYILSGVYSIPIFDKYILDSRRLIYSNDDTIVFYGFEKDTKENIALKLKKKFKSDSKYLIKEFKIYKELQGIERIPKVYTVGDQNLYRILITEYLGYSLQDIIKYLGGKFSLTTTLKISIQVLKIIKEIHERGVVLRYLKPGNMVIGKGKNRHYIYLLDFEIAKKYIKNGEHIPYKENKSVKGNRVYISINVHCGKEISRRDDIESFGYNLIYFVKGKLPWSNLKDSHSIRNKKIQTTLDELCEGLPGEFKEFIKYARGLEFTQEPDYNYLNELLLKVAEKNSIDIEKDKYDWTRDDKKKEDEKEENKNKTLIAKKDEKNDIIEIEKKIKKIEIEEKKEEAHIDMANKGDDELSKIKNINKENE